MYRTNERTNAIVRLLIAGLPVGLGLGLVTAGCYQSSEEDDDEPAVIISGGDAMNNGNGSGGGNDVVGGGDAGGTSSDSSTNTNGDDGGTTTKRDTGPNQQMCKVKQPSGFKAAPTTFSVPTPRCGEEFDAIADYRGDLRYQLVDLTADGQSDLVVTAEGCDEAVGTKRWDFYPASDSGFAKSPKPYRIPTPRCDTEFDFSSGGARGKVEYMLRDMTGDAYPDLVIYDEDCDEAVGRSRWDVYKGGAEGFARTPTDYGLPSPRCNESFDGPSGRGDLEYGLRDMTGDGWVDIVVYDEGCDENIGSTRWDVYAGGKNGFEKRPTEWSLPTTRCNDPFDALASTRGEVEYTLMDFTGDGASDLVVVDEDCDEAIGRSRWDLYPAQKSGFAKTPTSYGLPTPRCSNEWDGIADYRGDLEYLTTRVACESFPSLVVTEDACDEAVGRSRWGLYRGKSGAFAQQPSSFSLPAPRCNEDFDAWTDSGGDLEYSVLNLRGDGGVEVVVFDDGCDTDIGKVHWDVYELK